MQSILSTRLDFTRKLFFINPNYAVGCAGDTKNITPFIVHLTQALRDRTELYTPLELYSLLYHEVIPAFCAKEREIAQKIYNNANELRPIQIEALFAARTKGDDGYELLKINIFVARYGNSKSDDCTLVQQVNAGAIGTGGQIIEPVINQVMRIMDKRGYNFSSWSVKLASLFCQLLLLFAHNSDAATGDRSAGLFVSSSHAQEENPSRMIKQRDFVPKGEGTWQEFIFTALKEMPKFRAEIPFGKFSLFS